MTESQSGLPPRATPVTVVYLLVTAALAALFHQTIAQWPAIVIAHITLCAALVRLNRTASSSASSTASQVSTSASAGTPSLSQSTCISVTCRMCS
jgi:hypothetical protein